MSSSNYLTFSSRVIQEIFGQDFSTELQSRQNVEQMVDTDGSNPSSAKDSLLHDGTGGKGVISSTKGNIENLFKQHVEDTDGLKPNKSPRTGNPTTTVLLDPILPIRNFIRKQANLPISQHFAKAPPPTDALGELMHQRLKTSLTAMDERESRQNEEGRLGPRITKFDIAAHVGSFVMTSDRLGVTSQCNFGSVRANIALFKGKWHYEIQLGSKGVMQLGWATLNTKFSQEKGVGDTTDSFGYDGNRLRKWNNTTAPYGEAWQVGDIIGCLIDLNEGSIEFYRNGKSLTQAFSNIPRGPGIAYFPAVSLAWGENVVVNFGASPLQFPVHGYLPIQPETPAADNKMHLLFDWLDNSLNLYLHSEDIVNGRSLSREDYQTLLIVTNRIFEFLAPSMNSAFIVEQAFLPFYARTIGLPEKVAIQDEVIIEAPESHVKVNLLLELMWTYLEEAEMKKCIERMCNVFMNCFRSNSLSLSYPFQVYSLRCLIALVENKRSRRYLIHHILFDKIKLTNFMHIRPVDDEILKVLIPNGWWSGKSDSGNAEAEALEYQVACDSIGQHIQAVEEVQMHLLRTLLTNTDGNEKRPSSRSLFLRKFRVHIRDTIRPGSLLQHPLNKALCTFFRILKLTTLLWKEEVEPNENFDLPDLPPKLFYDMTIDYQDAERLGGVANYLFKTHHEEVSRALSIPDYMAGIREGRGSRDTPMPSFFGVQNFTGLTIPIASLSSPSVAVSMEDGASESGTTGFTVSAGNMSTAVTELSSHAAIDTTSIRESESVGVGVSTSPSVPNPVNTLNQTLNFFIEETFRGGSQTPQVGFIRSPAALTTVSHTENVPDLRTASATSSAEDMTSSVPRMNALIAGTTSGTNLMIPMYDFPADTAIRLLPGGFLGFSTYDRTGIRPNNPATSLVGRDAGTMDPQTSIRELLDDTVMIYSCGVKKHVEKIVSLRRNTEEYVRALERARGELKRPSITEVEKIEVEKSIEVFSRKLDEQSRHMAWVQSGVFTPERQRLAFQLLKVVLKTLKTGSSQGILFVFVPEFYVTTMIHLTWLILTQFHPTVPYTDLLGIDEVMDGVCEFVATHFTDTRVAIADTKDTLTQALCAFVCNRIMLTSLERIPESSKKRMVKALLRPYENRAWAQSNWILVRIWQGNGFGFRYPNSAQARKAFRTKPIQDEFGISSNLPPTPSPILQQLVASVLIDDPRLASNYIHSVLNQLNWAFSEFVGLLQEIHSGANRSDRAYMESRQLKICCTCFELTQSLLRVIEMVIKVSPNVLTDFRRESTESLLYRLCMLVSQVLNRVGNSSGTFAQVMELGISGVENITYFPIMSAVAGIIVSLLETELDKDEPSSLIVTKALLQEPSFQITSLNFLLGKSQSANTPEILRFSLGSYVPEDVTQEEIEHLEEVLQHVANWAPRLEADNESISDDDVCTICYAYPKSVTFKPCNHRSCRSCILHHLLNRGECFFCKGIIEQVVADDGLTIHDINATSPDSESETTVSSADQYM